MRHTSPHYIGAILFAFVYVRLQVRVLRNVAFQHKQRAIREALAIGEQVARRRRRALLASTFMAWHVQVSCAEALLADASAGVAAADGACAVREYSL
jgi:hypothetical protein